MENSFIQMHGAHETVGEMPTIASDIDICAIAKGCGYKRVCSIEDPEALDTALEEASSAGILSLIEVKCAIGARDDLGRPTTTPKDNKDSFMKLFLSVF